MRIALIHGFVGGGGGTEKTLLALIEGFAERNFVVNLYTVSKPSVSIKNVKINSILPFHFPFFGLYQRYLESKLVRNTRSEDLIVQA